MSKQLFIESDGSEVQYDGQRYVLPATKTPVEEAFVSHLGVKADAALSHVLAQHAVSKLSGIVVDGKSVDRVKLSVEYTEDPEAEPEPEKKSKGKGKAKEAAE